MEKKLVLNEVVTSPSSIFSKKDVIKLIDSIDETPIKIYQKEVKEEPTVSLFDYLGYPAGARLGADVYEVARRTREEVQTRIIETKLYKGKVMVYRKVFLDEYFKAKVVVNRWTNTQT